MINNARSLIMDKEHKIDETKTNTPFYWKYEQKWIAWAIPKVPSFLSSRFMTWFTVIWALITVACGYLSQYNKFWIWGISISVVGQYITDSLDGALGRFRNSGLINWGHYVDHLLDYVFLCAVLIAYTFIFPKYTIWLMIMLAIIGGHYASTFLFFSISKKFHMATSGIGMNELKVALIIFNIIIMYYTTSFVETMLIIMNILGLLTLLIAVYSGQKEAEKIDIVNKENNH